MKTISLQILFSLIAIEIIFRLFGYQPYSVQKYSLTSQPNKYMLPDDSLGFRLNEGYFNVIINDSVKYSATHNSNGLRIIENLNSTKSDSTKNLLFGGSFPYGMGIDDSLSYPFLINQKQSQLFENHCVPGFGMVQSIIQLDKEIQKPAIKINQVILHYASFYDDRNALTPDYRIALHHGFMNSNKAARALYSQANYPYIKGKKQENFEIAYQPLDKIYRNWWLRNYSASINFIQTLTDKNHSSIALKNSKSQWIIQQLNDKYCQPNNIKLTIATITNDAETDKIKTFCQQKNIETVDLFVDYAKPEYSNLPHDSHPNATAHALYAKKMLAFLNKK